MEDKTNKCYMYNTPDKIDKEYLLRIEKIIEYVNLMGESPVYFAKKVTVVRTPKKNIKTSTIKFKDNHVEDVFDDTFLFEIFYGSKLIFSQYEYRGIDRILMSLFSAMVSYLRTPVDIKPFNNDEKSI